MLHRGFFGAFDMGSGGGSTKGVEVNSDGTATILLDPLTVQVLMREAKSSRKSMATFAVATLREAMEDMADAREARRILARIKAGREKTVDSADVYRRHGL